MPAIEASGINPFFSTMGDIVPKGEKKKDTKKTSFGKVLERTQEEVLQLNEEYGLPEIEGKSVEETLQYLVDSVYEAGDKLKQAPYTDEFKNYKKVLARCMRFVVKNSYDIETHERRIGRKRQVFTLVTVVNTKLDELALGILYNQAEQLKILAKIEEINGLLIDFFS
ncbi:MAG: YaaR family protein [Spirochaetales bacterium]